MPKFYVGSGGSSSGGGGGAVTTTPIAVVAASGTITPNAALGSLFRHIANADVILAAPTGAVDGQQIVVEVLANNAARGLTIAGSTDVVTIPSGTWWTGRLIYHTTGDVWILDETSGSAAIPSVLYPPRSSSHSTGITLDASAAGNNFNLTVSANVAFNVPTGMTDHQALQVVILASGGTRTITLSGSFARVAGVDAAYAVPSGKVLRLSLRYSSLIGACLVEAAAVQQ